LQHPLPLSTTKSLKIDGIFGDNTEKFVYRLQKIIGINQDSIVTEDVWKKTLKYYETLNKEELKRAF
jgi:peptidoglycan hydrolase-like protein with peptidoglycan-binding domain